MRAGACGRRGIGFPAGRCRWARRLSSTRRATPWSSPEHVIEVLNTQHNPFYGVAGLTYNFRIIGPPVAGSLARKAGADLGIPAFILSPRKGGRAATRPRWPSGPTGSG